MSLIEENLEEWLSERSVTKTLSGNQIIFTHSSNEISTLFMNPAKAAPYQFASSRLSSFYQRYLGASFGNGHVVIGTPIRGGLQCATGDVIPDLELMRQQSIALGLPLIDGLEVFMIEAAWMFMYYCVGPDLYRFDRDFKKIHSLNDIGPVVKNWWKIVVDDPDMNPRANQ